MKTLTVLLLFIPSVALSQPQDRDFTLTIPAAREAQVMAICDEVRKELDPVPQTITLTQCMRRVLFAELRQRNAKIEKRLGIASRATEINDFDTGMAD